MQYIEPDMTAIAEFERQSRIRALEAELAQLRGEQPPRNRAARRASRRARASSV